ncbi:TetR/AcrR family transcriptional regulator [Amycolatopsis lurida]
MSGKTALRDHVANGIIDTAAGVLATRRDAGMGEIAAAAGVGRATLYRYFSNREELLRALAARGVDELGQRMAEADLAGQPVPEALARVTRALVLAGRKYIALADLPRDLVDAGEIDRRMTAPLRALLRRGTAEGVLRGDLDQATLLAAYLGLLRSLIVQSIQDGQGAEAVSTAVTALFLRGAGSSGAEDRLP